jgi:phage virion morphogenesis protein
MAEPIPVHVEIDENVSAALDRALGFSGDLTPAMKELATYFEGVTKERFETGIGPDGKAWKPSQRVVEHGGKTLKLHGDLQTSITSTYGPDFAEVGPERSFGAAIYAAIHQFGGIILPRLKKALSFGGRIVSRVVMPARPYVGFRQADQSRAAAVLSDFLGKAVAG